jgi:chromosome segregation ATPase
MNKYKAYAEAANDPEFMQESKSMNPQGYVDPTSKYYIDRMWEEYHKVKNDLAAVRIDASSAWQEYHKMKEELAVAKSKLGQLDDYVNEVLKPELAEAKIKLKMAQSAWDELDKSHAARAKLHDELIIAEGQRDQWKMKYEESQHQLNELQLQVGDWKDVAEQTIAAARGTRLDAAGERQLRELVEERTELCKTVAFFASVIKSGESWSDTCQTMYNNTIIHLPSRK